MTAQVLFSRMMMGLGWSFFLFFHFPHAPGDQPPAFGSQLPGCSLRKGNTVKGTPPWRPLPESFTLLLWGFDQVPTHLRDIVGSIPNHRIKAGHYLFSGGGSCFQYVKTATPVKCNKAKYYKTRCARTRMCSLLGEFPKVTQLIGFRSRLELVLKFLLVLGPLRIIDLWPT